MPDDNTPQDGGNPPADKSPQGDTAGALGKQVADLTTQLNQSQSALEKANARIKELEGSTGNLTTANNKANEELTAAKQQLAQTQKELDAKMAELTNVNTQMEQLNGQFGEATANHTKAQQELGLYKMIAETPEYHGLIGMIDGIKIVDDADQQKAILDSMAGAIKGQVDSTLELFRAGGTPPTNPGGNPGPQGPKDVKEAHARLQQIVGMPGFEQEAQALQAFILQAQNGTNIPA